MSSSMESGSRTPDAADLASLLSGENGAFVEALFEDYVTGRAQVPESWRRLFEGLAGAPSVGNGPLRHPPAAPLRAQPPAAADGATPGRPVQSAPRSGPGVAPVVGIFGLVNAYRTHGHLIADLDPLSRGDSAHPLLDPLEFGLEERHLDIRGSCGNFLGLPEGTPRELISSLRETYCGTFAVEFMEMRDKERRDWLIERMEPIHNHPPLTPAERQRTLGQVLAAERLEQFLHKRFVGQKRFSLEGGEALIPLIDTITEQAAETGAKELVLAMAHRGRLNVLCHTLGMPYRALFTGFQPSLLPPNAQGAGDVKYHTGFSADRTARCGRSIHLSLCPNPSHLEWINPVAEGIVRAKQNFRGDQERHQVIPILIHGDAAFTGQGIVAETLALSELENYWTGGTIHIIVNNQIGFTTIPEDYRFTRHPSDMAKIIQAPVFHVNADDPEACVHAARLAIDFRQRFKEDVILDLVCYRRHGHNEGDDPTFTQPVLYRKIADHTRVGTLYTERLLQEQVLDRPGLAKLEQGLKAKLNQAMDEADAHVQLAGAEGYHGLWSEFESGGVRHDRPSSISREAVDQIAEALLTCPHPPVSVSRVVTTPLP